jgi:carbonic anhydrase
MTHHCKAAVVTCIDYRFHEAVEKWLKDKGLNGNVDFISMAGAVKDFGMALDELDISKRLHAVKEIYLVNHQDCGAYGPAVAADKKQESKTHKRDLLEAKKMLEYRYPGVKVETYFLTLDKEMKLVE